jgi:hypothetical protein
MLYPCKILVYTQFPIVPLPSIAKLPFSVVFPQFIALKKIRQSCPLMVVFSPFWGYIIGTVDFEPGKTNRLCKRLYLQQLNMGQNGPKGEQFMRNRKMLRTMSGISALCAMLALSACFNPPLEVGKKAEAQQFTADGRPLINIQVSLGGGGGGPN